MAQIGRVLDRSWVDIHGHFHPPLSSNNLVSRWHATREAGFLLNEPFEWNLDTTLAYLNKAGIALQLLSNIPKDILSLKTSNNFGAEIVAKHPTRFGLLAALPTDNPQASLDEIERASTELNADGFAVTCCYNGVYLSDPSLDVVWAELDRRGASVFIHPDAATKPTLGRPAALIEVAFETCRTMVSMLYNGHLSKYQNLKLIVAHCGGSLPVLSSRLQLLGPEEWVPNPHGLSEHDIKEQLSRLYVDTAATVPSALGAALLMTSCSHIVYGSDCGVPCSSERTLEQNRKALLDYDGLTKDEIQSIGTNVLTLFPAVKKRMFGISTQQASRQCSNL